jgi:YVTN family beta-propeller protein
MIEMREPVVALALSADGAVLYAVTPESNSLAIVNVMAGQVVATVPVGLTPLGLTVAPGGRVLVANSVSNDLTVVDPVARLAIAQIAVGKRPVALAIGPDGAFAYVANSESNDVSVVDLGRLEQLKTVPVGQKPVAVAVAPVQMVASTRPPGTASVAQNDRPPASSAILGGATEATARGAAGSGPSVIPKALPNTGDGSVAVATGPSVTDIVPYAGAGIAVGMVLAFVRRRLVQVPGRS